MKKALGVITILVALSVLLILSFTIELPYFVRSQGVVMPVKEWSLTHSAGGSLRYIYENHIDGFINEYGITEVQRGDVARYQFNEELLQKGFVKKGDTLAKLFTSDIQLKIIELKGELAYQRSLLAVSLAGEKPEEVRMAENRVELARQEFENQKKQTERIIQLFNEEVVSQQEYELAVNALKVREYELDIALSFYSTLTSGRKAEDIQAIRSRMEALEQQIDQIQRHTDAFHLVSPIDGTILRERNPVLINESEVILRIADFSSFVVLVPVDHAEEANLHPGQQVIIKSSSGNKQHTGTLITIDRNVRLINNQPKIFLTILLDDEPGLTLFRNMMVQAKVDCGRLKFWPYLDKVSRAVYQN